MDPEAGQIADSFRAIAANVVKQTRMVNASAASNVVEIQL
jgi:hypothetical protein